MGFTEGSRRMDDGVLRRLGKRLYRRVSKEQSLAPRSWRLMFYDSLSRGARMWPRKTFEFPTGFNTSFGPERFIPGDIYFTHQHLPVRPLVIDAGFLGSSFI